MPSAFAPGWAQNVIALLCFQLDRKSPALALKKPRVMAQAGGQVSPRMTRPGPPPGPSQASLFVQSAKIRSCKHTNWPWTIPGVCEKYKLFLLFVEVGFVFGDHSILFEKDSAEEERSRPGSPFIKNRSKITRRAGAGMLALPLCVACRHPKTEEIINIKKFPLRGRHRLQPKAVDIGRAAGKFLYF